MPTWLLFGFLTIILWGVASFFGKVAANHLPGSSVKVYGYLGNTISTAYVFYLASGRIEPHYQAGAIAIGAGLLAAFAILFQYLSLSRGGRASVILPLINLSSLITVLLAYAILKERLSPVQAAGIACALGSIILLS